MEPLNFTLIVISVFFLAIKYFNKTDVPKIKNLPEIPGVPIFGNLIQLGDEHARKAREWVKQYGDVFQVRMGNKVSNIFLLVFFGNTSKLTVHRELYSQIHSIL